MLMATSQKQVSLKNQNKNSFAQLWYIHEWISINLSMALALPLHYWTTRILNDQLKGKSIYVTESSNRANIDQ